MPRRPSASLLLASTATTAAPGALTDDPPVTSRPDDPDGVGPGGSRPPRSNPFLGARTPGRLYAVLAGLTLGLAAFTLLAPSTPSYDPWSWSLWAREIIHGHLVITDTGTSWKPLPMIFTIPFALLGRAGPNLWLVIARAGAIAAVLEAFRLAFRLTRALARPGERGAAVIAPAVLAGIVALVGLGFAAEGSYITSNGLGYSEAFAATLLLITIECLLDGRHRAAFGLGFLVALDRPEVWLFWVPFGIWLWRRDPAMRAWIAAAFVLQPVAWFLPVYLGSGHVGASVTRATHPRSNSLAYASDPFWAELSQAAWPTMMLRLKIMAGLVICAAPLAAWWSARRGVGRRERVGRGLTPVRSPRVRVVAIAAVLGLGGLAWFVVIGVMTEIGFSGNDRYLVLGAALVDVCAAVGFGWLALEVGRACARLRGRRGLGAGALGTGAAAVGTVTAAAVFAFAPGWIGTRDFVSLPAAHRALLYQARLRADLPRAIALAGGTRRVLACGRVMTEGFQVPMVAYALDVPTTRILAPPHSRARRGPVPNTVLQTRATLSATELPFVRYWHATSYRHDGTVGPWHVYTHCASGS